MAAFPKVQPYMLCGICGAEELVYTREKLIDTGADKDLILKTRVNAELSRCTKAGDLLIEELTC